MITLDEVRYCLRTGQAVLRTRTYRVKYQAIIITCIIFGEGIETPERVIMECKVPSHPRTSREEAQGGSSGLWDLVRPVKQNVLKE